MKSLIELSRAEFTFGEDVGGACAVSLIGFFPSLHCVRIVPSRGYDEFCGGYRLLVGVIFSAELTLCKRMTSKRSKRPNYHPKVPFTLYRNPQIHSVNYQRFSNALIATATVPSCLCMNVFYSFSTSSRLQKASIKWWMKNSSGKL